MASPCWWAEAPEVPRFTAVASSEQDLRLRVAVCGFTNDPSGQSGIHHWTISWV
jgi:hypothetical protein